MALLPKPPKAKPAKADDKDEELGTVAEAALTPEEFAAGGKPDEAPTPPPVPVAVPAPAAPALPGLYRVLEDAKVMLDVCNTRFVRGQVLNRNHFKARTFAVLLQALKTEPVKE